jgi:hypothetical protein
MLSVLSDLSLTITQADPSFRSTDTPLNPKRKIMSKDEQAIEAEIQSKGLNAPRLTPELIDDAVVAEAYHVFPGTTLTVCALTLRNGFQVSGESAAADARNFDEEIGRKIARTNARNKIWALEGYLLKQKLYEAAANSIHFGE